MLGFFSFLFSRDSRTLQVNLAANYAIRHQISYGYKLVFPIGIRLSIFTFLIAIWSVEADIKISGRHWRTTIQFVFSLDSTGLHKRHTTLPPAEIVV